MAKKEICSKCGKVCKNKGGLEMHIRDKHDSQPQEPKIENKKSLNKTPFVLGIIILLILAFVFWAFTGISKNSNLCQETPAELYNIGGHDGISMHIHPILKIIIDGQQQRISSGIGVLPGIMRPVHTHDSSGEIHVEAPCFREFTLKEFFDVWNKELSSECIFDYCTNNGTLSTKLNGKEITNPQNILLKNHQEILITYNSN